MSVADALLVLSFLLVVRGVWPIWRSNPVNPLREVASLMAAVFVGIFVGLLVWPFAGDFNQGQVDIFRGAFNRGDRVTVTYVDGSCCVGLRVAGLPGDRLSVRRGQLMSGDRALFTDPVQPRGRHGLDCPTRTVPAGHVLMVPPEIWGCDALFRIELERVRRRCWFTLASDPADQCHIATSFDDEDP